MGYCTVQIVSLQPSNPAASGVDDVKVASGSPTSSLAGSRPSSCSSSESACATNAVTGSTNLTQSWDDDTEEDYDDNITFPGCSPSYCADHGTGSGGGISSHISMVVFYFFVISVPACLVVGCIIVVAHLRCLRDRKRLTKVLAQQRFEKTELDATSKIPKTHGRCEL